LQSSFKHSRQKVKEDYRLQKKFYEVTIARLNSTILVQKKFAATGYAKQFAKQVSSTSPDLELATILFDDAFARKITTVLCC